METRKYYRFAGATIYSDAQDDLSCLIGWYFGSDYMTATVPKIWTNSYPTRHAVGETAETPGNYCMIWGDLAGNTSSTFVMTAIQCPGYITKFKKIGSDTKTTCGGCGQVKYCGVGYSNCDAEDEHEPRKPGARGWVCSQTCLDNYFQKQSFYYKRCEITITKT